jgi:hypothetical protein
MLMYQVAYRMQLGMFFAEVFDFPEATALGPSLPAARANLFSALRYAAESRLKRGELLPTPGPQSGDIDAYLVERVVVLPGASEGVLVQSAE